MPWIPQSRERLSQRLGRQLASRLVIPQLSCRRLGCSCTANSARSRVPPPTGTSSAPSPPHPPAPIPVLGARSRRCDGRRHRLDLAGHRPADLADVLSDGDLVVVVCDNAHEELDPRLLRLHWSIPDPVRVDTDAAFEAAYTDIAGRVDRLAPALDHGADHA
jgi:ArsR family transcriptional regulator, arsenate/arsenite/antimonite-responsive transcriptional repressor / arsenate reductase (thioredoxin)